MITDTQSPAYFQQSQTTLTPSLLPPPSTMEITYDSWRRSRMSITPTNASSPLYQVSCSSLRHRLVFSNTNTTPSTINTSNAASGDSSNPEFATSNFHCYKSSFTVHLHNHTIPVASDKIWRIQRSYISPSAFAGRKLIWKTTRSCGRLEFVCLDDETALPLARLRLRNGWKRVGVIEFVHHSDDGYNGPLANTANADGVGVGDFKYDQARRGREGGLSPEQMEELVVIGLTIAYQVVQSSMAASSAASAASSSAAVSVAA